ncbi:MAG TPA: hypothetical protein VI319_09240 [Burkholderiales bacterium]
MARSKPGFWSRGIDKLRGALLHGEPETASQAPKKKAEQKKPEKKKPAQPARPATAVAKSPEPATTEAVASTATMDDKSPKRKIPVQPWYRHRQRW